MTEKQIVWYILLKEVKIDSDTQSVTSLSVAPLAVLPEFQRKGIGGGMLDNLVKGNMGRHWRPFVNYIGTIMVFIFFSNTSGLFGLRPPTADYGTTLALALITFVLIQYSAFKTSKLHVFTDLFKPIPILFPINLIGEFATPLSMSLRLFGNIMAGTIMMALWYGLLPWLAQLGIPAFLHMYFDLFSGAIQTFVFAMLTMTFITDKREA